MQFPTRGGNAIDDDDGSSDWESGSGEDVAAAHVPPPQELSSVYESLMQSIDDLGGRVVPKMQWSCPKDAAWILPNNTIECSTPDEVFMLLKSSDRIAHDIDVLNCILQSRESPRSPLGKEREDRESESSQEQDTIPDHAHVIAVRKWYHLKPGREFRCFVRNNTLVAVCQRDLSMKFEHLLGASMEKIIDRIKAFYDTVIHTQFSLDNFIFDCYVPESENASVRVIDFTPDIIATTNPLLFSWEDIDKCYADRACDSAETSSKRPEYRCIEQNIPLKPESALYGVPFDFVDSSQGSALNTLLEQARSAGL